MSSSINNNPLLPAPDPIFVLRGHTSAVNCSLIIINQQQYKHTANTKNNALIKANITNNNNNNNTTVINTTTTDTTNTNIVSRTIGTSNIPTITNTRSYINIPFGIYLLTGSTTGELYIWNLFTRRCIKIIKISLNSNSSIINILYNHELDYIIIQSKSGIISIYKLADILTNTDNTNTNTNTAISAVSIEPEYIILTNSFGFYNIKSYLHYLILPTADSKGIQLFNLFSRTLINNYTHIPINIQLDNTIGNNNNNNNCIDLTAEISGSEDNIKIKLGMVMCSLIIPITTTVDNNNIEFLIVLGRESGHLELLYYNSIDNTIKLIDTQQIHSQPILTITGAAVPIPIDIDNNTNKNNSLLIYNGISCSSDNSIGIFNIKSNSNNNSNYILTIEPSAFTLPHAGISDTDCKIRINNTNTDTDNNITTIEYLFLSGGWDHRIRIFTAEYNNNNNSSNTDSSNSNELLTNFQQQILIKFHTQTVTTVKWINTNNNSNNNTNLNCNCSNCLILNNLLISASADQRIGIFHIQL